MRHRFTCQAITSNDGIRRVHLVADDGQDRGDVFLNIPYGWFGPHEEPREGDDCTVTINVHRQPTPEQKQ